MKLKRMAMTWQQLNGITISFDNENYFYISENMTKTDQSLLSLLYEGIKDGALFLDEYHSSKYQKAIKIIQSKNIIIANRITFDLENVGAAVEIFARRIHDHYSHNLYGKIVVDIGASVGDTPLYFASKGARVYAVEMTDTNFQAMKKNMDLNPELSENILPLHMALATDDIIQYYEDSLGLICRQGGSSMVKPKFENTNTKKVQGISLGNFRKRYHLTHIDLLKLDCKGAEFYLKEEELYNIDTIKIEYYSLIPQHKIEALITMLKKNYDVIIYKHTPNDTTSFLKHGNILATKR